jgi:glutamyl-tRNA reductase
VLTREHVTTPTVILDLAVPRDVDPAVADVAGVTLIDMARLATAAAADRAEKSAEEAVIDIVAAEVDAFRLQLRGADVAPTVAALRARADDLVAAELAKLRTKRPDLTDEQRSDVAQTVHRIVQRLLHTPSVRVRELAAEPGGDRYAEVLRDLFGLDVPPVVATYAEIPTVMEPVVESQSAADIPPAAGGQPVEPTVGDER